MRSKSRFTTLVLLETRERYLQIRVQSLFAATVARGHATFATKRRYPFTRNGLPPAGSHQLAWRTAITGCANSRRQFGAAWSPSACPRHGLHRKELLTRTFSLMLQSHWWH